MIRWPRRRRRLPGVRAAVALVGDGVRYSTTGTFDLRDGMLVNVDEIDFGMIPWPADRIEVVGLDGVLFVGGPIANPVPDDLVGAVQVIRPGALTIAFDAEATVDEAGAA